MTSVHQKAKTAQQADEAGAEDHASELQPADIDVLHPEDGADGGDEGAERAQEWAMGSAHQMVIVIGLRVTVGHFHFSPELIVADFSDQPARSDFRSRFLPAAVAGSSFAAFGGAKNV